jgi:hypothetical protein
MFNCLVALLVLLIMAAPAGAQPAVADKSASKIAFPPVLRPVLPKLQKSKIPVFLPTWLPSGTPMYATVSLEPYKDEKGIHQGYALVIAEVAGEDPPMYSRILELHAYEKTKPFHGKKKVPIGTAIVGTDISGPKPMVEWSVGGNNYQMSAGPDVYKIAKSMAPLQR